jgi:release factor glutamine methyltransferase
MKSVVQPDLVEQLRAAGCVFAEDEAAVLTEAAPDAATLRELVRRRVEGEPLEQVVGYADFCGVRVRLRPGVFVPRIRSGLLVTLAAAHAEPGSTVLDLCCGSGALGLAVRHRVPSISLHAADADPAAVACARDNLGADVHHSDLFSGLPHHLRGAVDVLLANVPYVATRHLPFLPAEARLHEPRTALDGGEDGLDLFRAVVAEAPAWLASGGLLLSEVTEAQIPAAVDAVRAAGLQATVHSDDDLDATVVTGASPRR